MSATFIHGHEELSTLSLYSHGKERTQSFMSCEWSKLLWKQTYRRPYSQISVLEHCKWVFI